jgi:hypothetical protein
MYLYGPENTTSLIETDDDDGEGSASRIVRSLSPGNYYVKIRSFNNVATGTYLISVKSAPTAALPASLTVPLSDDDGSYTVSWGASGTSSVAYVLEEATNSSFSSGLRTAYSGSSTSAPIIDRGRGKTYYYRVKATRSGYTDSDWKNAMNGCSVKNLPIAVAPAGLTVPATDDDGGYEVSWEASSSAGNVTYVLEEASNSGFSTDLRTAYSGSSTSISITERSNWKTYFYRVKATLDGYTDSAWRYGLNGCKVTYALVVMPPATLSVPSSDGNGSYTVSWGASSTGSASYVLEEATNYSFNSDLRTAYSGSATSTPITERVGGVTYYYRVKATRDGYKDSDWKNGANGCRVTVNYLTMFLQLLLTKLLQLTEFLN